MRDLIIGALAIAGAACAAPTNTTTTPTTATTISAEFSVLNPRDYQSFVGAWTPEDRPLCAVFASATDWVRQLHPAALMGARNVFAPPGTLWNNHAVLFLARIANGGDPASVFQITGVTRGAGETVVDYTFTNPPTATYTQRAYFAVAVEKPLTGVVRFRENGQVVCEATAG